MSLVVILAVDILTCPNVMVSARTTGENNAPEVVVVTVVEEMYACPFRVLSDLRSVVNDPLGALEVDSMSYQ